MATRHFDSSILKITEDGRRVLSSFVEDGEELVSDIIDRKHREQPHLRGRQLHRRRAA